MSYIYICYMICVHYKSIQVVRIRFLPSGPSAVHALAARAPRLQVPEAQSKALENTESEETRWEATLSSCGWGLTIFTGHQMFELLRKQHEAITFIKIGMSCLKKK